MGSSHKEFVKDSQETNMQPGVNVVFHYSWSPNTDKKEAKVRAQLCHLQPSAFCLIGVI